jgi:hypothetical protein
MARGEVELSVGVGGGGGGAGGMVEPPVPISLGRLILAGMVAGGVQYGWALQLSLLTPYVQVYACIHLVHTDTIQLAEYLRVRREGMSVCRPTMHARTYLWIQNYSTGSFHVLLFKICTKLFGPCFVFSKLLL